MEGVRVEDDWVESLLAVLVSIGELDTVGSGFAQPTNITKQTKGMKTV